MSAPGAPIFAPPPRHLIADDVQRALKEDLGRGDLTAALVPAGARSKVIIVCREAAVLCGVPWAEEVFRQLAPEILLDWNAGDGDAVVPGALVCTLGGPTRALLSGERTALNFLQTLSAAATVARRYVEAVAGTGVRILDTRKTLPGLRLAQKYAVRCGGGSNHRIGLFDAVLIKENHIQATGSIAAALEAARRLSPEIEVEVEVESADELRQALAAGAQRILLDDFDVDGLRAAVLETAGRARLEASGGVDLTQVRRIAETGVDDISVGGLTKHVQAIDLSMRFVETDWAGRAAT
jgi:nicotinate-nucleotide pyrophosphorylase (carboxylating)